MTAVACLKVIQTYHPKMFILECVKQLASASKVGGVDVPVSDLEVSVKLHPVHHHNDKLNMHGRCHLLKPRKVYIS